MLGDRNCTLSEYFRVRNAACGTNSTIALDSTENFGIALVSASRQCRSSFEHCIGNNAAATSLFTSTNYCEGVQFSSFGFSLQSCSVVDSGCTQSEYDRLRQTFCGATSLSVGALSLVLSSLVLLLKKQ
ncbi:hypothetical protein Bpfe_007793 [Biomphalaria pfeifferi]|uniref:Transmembrane protein n=1 Tax=Biomphalaria pfeifferi TaxID=112525 RepID=A0AAD8BYN9_BIOPF|nr:hypothetical protein Bpfe_007793 [Biomphalaria pfeifferi]